MTERHEIVFDDDGLASFVHSDHLAGLIDGGVAVIERASHVEPSGVEWIADMAPVGGPVLGPYENRGDALAAEVGYISRNYFGFDGNEK